MTTHPNSEPSPPAAPPAGGLAAVLFDMDGTLVDSEGLWAEAEKEVCADLGCPWDAEDHHRNLGSAVGVVARYMVERAGARAAPEVVAAMLVGGFRRRLADGAPPRPGAEELVAEVAASEVPAALVTSTPRALIAPALSRIGTGHFDVIVAGDDVERNKPHPEPYLKAAHLLGADPARCVALEDSPTGTASARAAGCVTLAVPSMHPVDPAPGQTVLDSLAGVDLARLRALVSGRCR